MLDVLEEYKTVQASVLCFDKPRFAVMSVSRLVFFLFIDHLFCEEKSHFILAPNVGLILYS